VIANFSGGSSAIPVTLPAESVLNSMIEGGVHGPAMSAGLITVGRAGGGADLSATAAKEQKLW
jgi:hypothetical protein